MRACPASTASALGITKGFLAARHDLDGTAASAAGLEIDIENALEPLHPGHGGVPLSRCGGSSESVTLALLPLPRFAGVMIAPCSLFGANTP